ncbi:carbamoyltransferase HypF [Occallatibacter riparius]|uniref:Carbamoyltransferase n=1 Tax=Occallatibacter riparius TaxID=1002689 RepID=A0A9J7BLR1_9BACT|nr:carbamoyltransferase HypF [Occallatibacter riparius]UWZ83583.1 carbamoyltransferase HypF [Occallatibacter riparius]
MPYNRACGMLSLTIKSEPTVDPSSAQHRIRKSVLVRGVVQGVGFRPFVYRLAMQNALGGHIGNDTDGVTIEIEGAEHAVEDFLHRLTSDAPPISRIDSVQVSELTPVGETAFTIVHSQVLGKVSTGIPADAATCADCLRELLDPQDRRYRYPFLNCTNCGPRFTITRRIPYDRPQTSMAAFPMCAACRAEYDDPLNRRFHAQPNACWDCGPRVWLESPRGEKIASDDPIAQCIEELLAGRIMGIKGIGGFHLAVDATSEEAVTRLRERKHRYGKPLAVMVRDMEAARSLCLINDEESALLQTSARPIVIARVRAGSGFAPSVAPGIPWLGVYLPYAPLQHLLFADTRVRALVMTSANLSEEPIAIDNAEARQRLGNIADAFLMHNREILQRCDDTVTAIVDGAPQLIRRARGYVPLGIELPFDSPPLLAVGGHLKSVFTLARGRYAYQSQHLGDLENLTGLDFFTESLAHLMHTFEIEPQAVVHDLHPGYLSTTWAKQWAAEHNIPTIAVQHHHAHIAACMAEHAIQGPVIGLSLDGTGYGTDGRIWGGEVLIANHDSFERFAHLDYVALPGGDAAVREPWRMAFAHLLAAGFSEEEAGKLVGASGQETRLLSRMIERGINAPLTSSLGRLFDAVAAVVLNRRRVDYEAQAAIELEGVAVDEPNDAAGYELTLVQGDWAKREPMRINPSVLWKELVVDLRSGVTPAQIGARFHAGVADAFLRAAVAARAANGVATVAMSGGVMHNRRLARSLRRELESQGFEVFAHRRVSPGDGGLSYGQAAIGASKLKAV